MSEETGEPPGECLHSDTNYQQKWREETKAKLLQRAKIRKEQSFPELAQKLKVTIKRENIIAQKAVNFLKCVRESKYGLPEESFSIDDHRLTSSTHVDYSLPNTDSHVVLGSKPYNPSFVDEVCDKTVRPQKLLYEQDTLDHGKTSEISVLSDFEDTIDKVDDKIRKMSLLSHTEEDISNTPIEKNSSPETFITSDECINKSFESDLENLSDVSMTCSLKTDVGLDHLTEKQETHFMNRNAVARGKKYRKSNTTLTFEKLIFKSSKNKRIARIYLNKLPVVSQLDKSMTPKSW